MLKALCDHGRLWSIPMTQCSGTVLLYGIPRVIMGENDTFVGGEDWLKHKGVEIINVGEFDGRTSPLHTSRCEAVAHPPNRACI